MRRTSESAGRTAAALDADRGAHRRGSLRFLDSRLEREYQRRAGAESLTGFQITTGAAALLWLLAAVVIPAGTPIPGDRAIPVATAMGILNWAAFLLATRAGTLDRQHAIISLLTSVNGLVIL